MSGERSAHNSVDVQTANYSRTTNAIPRVQRWAGICLDGWPFVIIGIAVTGLVGWLAPAPWALLPGLLTLFTAYFFRDPTRNVPSNDNALISPADGKIVGVTRVPYPRFLSGDATRVSIFLSVFNVHINRIPFAGTIRETHYNKGKFMAAFAEKASLENEQMSVLLDTKPGIPVLVVQIAGLIARRIICRLQAGEEVSRGERFGLIRFGSRTDIYLPDNVDIRVAVGDKVSGGESVIGVFQ